MTNNNRIILGMGSNTEGDKNLDLACQTLKKLYPAIRFSKRYQTSPIGFKTNPDKFLNQLAIFYTRETEEELKRILKSLEKQSGRLPEDKGREIVRLDLDILKINDTPLKANELNRPYYQRALQDLNHSE